MNIIVTFIILYSLIPCFKAGPLVINTWEFTDANRQAWNYLAQGYDGIEALEAGCSKCEELQCDFTVGYGGSPDERGETTLDALIFDGSTMNMGAVVALRRIKSAISVAKHVLKYTSHSILAGDQATDFAIQMGFKEESLTTNTSKNSYLSWLQNNCQPNFWENVEPDPTTSCGPYTPASENSITYKHSIYDVKNHDTIGMIVIDHNNKIAAGTSTNGASHKIAGRVGDAPIPGAGAYADNSVGAAAATGDGDLMMRFLPSFLAVEEMRKGATPTEAAQTAILRIREYSTTFFGAVITANMKGEYGAACNGMESFKFCVFSQNQTDVKVETVSCQIDGAQN